MADQRTNTRNDEEDARERIERERLRGVAEEGEEEVDEPLADDDGELDDEDDARGVL
jgi:hypothetical protein